MAQRDNDRSAAANPTPTRPLAGLRVLDSAEDKGELCGRLLADLGAEVFRVEPPGGSASRLRAPFVAGEDSESLFFALRNAGKGSLTLDLESAEGRERLHELLQDTDVWIESTAPGFLEAHGLSPESLLDAHPHLVLTSITDFGRTGPYKDYLGSDMIGFAMGGMMHKAGAPHRPPCNAPGHLAYDATGLCAAFPTLLALYKRLDTGRGQHVDCSVFESIAATADWGIPNASLNPGFQARMGAGIYPLYRCADGFVRMVILVTSHWHSLLDWMGHPEEVSDPKYDQFLERLMAPHIINPVIERFFGTQEKTKVCEEGQRRGLPVTPLLEPAEAVDNVHTRARGTFAPMALGGGVTVPMPAGFLHIDGERVGPAAGPPALGADDARAADGRASRRALPAAGNSGRARPFEGMRVVDFGVGAVGVECSRLFAEYGADVIKIESTKKPDFMRALTPNFINPSFASSSRSKRSLGVDLKSERGLALVKKLIEGADLVVDNNATGVMDRLGIGAEDIRRMNPRAVTISSQSVGSQGPWSAWSGYGPSTHPVAGLQWLWNFPEDAEQPAGSTNVYPDHLVGRLGAVAAIASLLQREHTGRGSSSDIAQFETPLQLLGDLFAKESLDPGSVRPVGNRSEQGAPWGAYPCAGEDEWVAVCCRSDAQWQQLRSAMGDPEWARDAALDSVEGRRARHDAIDEGISAWTRERDPQAARDALQAAGVPAGDLQHALHLLADPQLGAREFIRVIDQPGLTTLMFEGPWYHASDLPPTVDGPAPLLGQHTREVCRELGLEDAAIDALLADGVLEEPAESAEG